MAAEPIVGESGTLRSALGEITKVVVGIRDGIIDVTSMDEYRRAREEGKDPLSMGYRMSDIVRARG